MILFERIDRNRGTSPKLAKLIQTSLCSCNHLHHNVVVFNFNCEIRSTLPQRSQRKFYLLVDVTLQKTRPIFGVEALFSEKVESRVANDYILTLALHLPPQVAQVKIGNLPYLIHRQRRKDNNFIDAIAKLRRETCFGSLHDF